MKYRTETEQYSWNLMQQLESNRMRFKINQTLYGIARALLRINRTTMKLIEHSLETIEQSWLDRKLTTHD